MRLSGRSGVCAGLALAVCLGAAGCGGLRLPGFGKSKNSNAALEIVPKNNRYALTVTPSADDIVAMMAKVGFLEGQILELGETLRNALATQGAAEVRRGKEVGAIFAAYQNDTVFISTRRGGTYIYDIRNGRFKLGDETPPSQPAPAPAAPAPGQGG
jgi:hypothetical protein